MDEINIITLILVSGILGIQISNESLLALRVKRFFFLSHPYSKKLLALSKFSTWWAFMPRWFIISLPLISVLVLVINVHLFLTDLLDCPYCLSFHLMWMSLFFVMGMNIIPSLVLAPLGILGVYIIEAIRR